MSKKIVFETTNLPQNVKLVGEKDEKSIYISFNAYKKVHEFTKNKFDNESGGLLLGSCTEAFNTTNILIYDFIEAKYTEATKTTLTFTHKTWEYLYKIIEKNYENAKIIGWIHTHPGFGIFLSDYDKFIQNNFFNDENQVAYVVDPKQKIEGFFAIINGNLQKCKGFYIFDEIGKDIKIFDSKEDELSKNEKKKNQSVYNNEKMFTHHIYFIVLLVLIIAMFFYFNSKINSLIIQSTSKLSELTRQHQNDIVNVYSNFNTIIAERMKSDDIVNAGSENTMVGSEQQDKDMITKGTISIVNDENIVE